MWLSISDPRITNGGLSAKKGKMMNVVQKALDNFVPKEYYEVVMDFYGVDVEKYPWMVRDFDPSTRTYNMHAVFNFQMLSEDGWPVAAMEVIYKSLQSKSSFKRIIYLDNMYPACQPPCLSSFRPSGEE